MSTIAMQQSKSMQQVNFQQSGTIAKALPLKEMAGLQASHHLFDDDQIAAIMAAWHAERPLLVRGEPGLGKSQLAHAIAVAQDWNLLVHVVNSRTEPDDLLYRVDHVARLAKAQLVHHNAVDISELEEQRFVVPGPLWWAYSAAEARKFFDEEHSDYRTSIEIDDNKPTVLLIDEIDKADSELPNSLLEVLNNHSFHAHGHDKPIKADKSKRPFVVITSNDQRQLPAAFLRRCVCLNLTMKAGDEGINQLIAIAAAHKEVLPQLSDARITEAAKLVIEQRKTCAAGEYTPGTSEFLDLLRVLNSEEYQTDAQRSDALAVIKHYILQK